MDLLKDPTLRAALARARRDSQAEDPINRHEEGGYVVQNPDGSLGVERWPCGEQSLILRPPMDAGKR